MIRGGGGLGQGRRTDRQSPASRTPHTRPALAAASYTLVAAAQKASSFIILILFTRVLSLSEYGQIALLTTVGVLLVMALSLGLEPRIIYAYFRADEDLPEYLHTARRVSVRVPLLVAVLVTVVIVLAPITHKQTWTMECVGSCLLAAGTTYSYAVLRAARRVVPYMTLALTLLVTQVSARVVLVVWLGRGPAGWAASDLIGGSVAIVVGYLTVRRVVPVHPGRGRFTSWGVMREGLPLVPHSLAQWGLSLSDRLILAAFVTTATLGVYSALYQIAAVTSLVLNEVNRALMPTYARNEPRSNRIPPLIRSHLTTAFTLHAVFLVLGFVAIEVVLPPAYSAHDELYPLLTLGALAYGLYFLPMNGLTLIAGITSRAPAISLSALALNIGVNLALDSTLGLWGAALGTAVGYAALALIALGFEMRTRSIPWKAAVGGQPLINVLYVGVIVATVVSTWAGAVRVCALTAAVAMVGAILAATLVERRQVGSEAR